MPHPKSGIVLRQGVAIGAETAKCAAKLIVSALDSGMNGVEFGLSGSFFFALLVFFIHLRSRQ